MRLTCCGCRQRHCPRRSPRPRRRSGNRACGCQPWGSPSSFRASRLVRSKRCQSRGCKELHEYCRKHRAPRGPGPGKLRPANTRVRAGWQSKRRARGATPRRTAACALGHGASHHLLSGQAWPFLRRATVDRPPVAWLLFCDRPSPSQRDGRTDGSGALRV
jgi:hypothetical protein